MSGKLQAEFCRRGLIVLISLALASCLRQPDGSVPVGTMITALSDSGALVHLRIDAIQLDPRDRSGELNLYTLTQFDPASAATHPYCAPDSEGKSRAIPVAGAWRADGTFTASDQITFACTSGAIGKCIRFGYKPWQTHQGVALRDYHQACVRMVRADYCGDGHAHTRDGTNIDIWDGLGVQVRTPNIAHPEVFEAAWGPDGAVYVNAPRWSDDLAKLIAECPSKLGNATAATRPLAEANLAASFPHALLFNAHFLQPSDRLAQQPTHLAHNAR
jgi:hypothetical protein